MAFNLREPANFYEPIPISERLVQAIWADQLFSPIGLTSRNGQSIQILDPGRWNLEGGPDFRGAHLRIGEQSRYGDIEIHLHTSGWNEHHHDSNSAYNKVILDACLWEADAVASLKTQNGKAVPQLILHSHLQCSLNELAESLDPDCYPFSPTRLATRSSPFLRLSRREVSNYVDSAGLFRFEQRTTRIVEMITQQGPDQTAYQLLAEALGYKYNKLPFRQIIHLFPLTSILGLTSTDSRIDALLAETEHQHLHFNHVRPANHPHRRLAALAIFVEQHPKLAEWFRDFQKHPIKLRQLPNLKHPFWSWHYHRQSKRLSKPIALVGSARWKEIVTNAILPFCHAESQIHRNTTASQQIHRIYRQLPSSQPNLASRQIAYDLGLSSPTKTLQQQGLIQIYQDFDLIMPEISSA